jgi:hypothetical protein
MLFKQMFEIFLSDKLTFWFVGFVGAITYSTINFLVLRHLQDNEFKVLREELQKYKNFKEHPTYIQLVEMLDKAHKNYTESVQNNASDHDEKLKVLELCRKMLNNWLFEWHAFNRKEYSHFHIEHLELKIISIEELEWFEEYVQENSVLTTKQTLFETIVEMCTL